VNALIPSQSLSLSDSCTIIFGLNGTGKSGYFRIIHELAGGDKTKNILSNIYTIDEGFEVKIDYTLNGKKQSQYKWEDKSIRDVAPFNQVKVFDSEYLPFFLNEHESSINIEPLGLNLFRLIISVIDEYKVKLGELVAEENEVSPDLQLLIQELHSEEISSLFQRTVLTELQKKKLFGEYAVFSDEDSQNLIALEGQKKDIEKNNQEDTTKVIKREKTNIEGLGTHLKSLKTNFEQLTKEVSKAIIDYLASKKVRVEQIKQFKVLKNVPSRSQEEWQCFIESAKEYGDIVDSKVFDKDKKCLYCHQLLSDEAEKVVQAYSKYLADKSQQNFVTSRNKIEELATKLDNLTIQYLIDESVNKILISRKNKEGKDFKDITTELFENAKTQKGKLKAGLENLTSIDGTYSLDLCGLDNLLIELSKERQKSLSDLNKSEEEKQKKSSALIEKINKLKDKQNLSKWRDKIKKYFKSCYRINCYSKTNQTIKTKGITELGAKAHHSLLTEKIRKTFDDELKILNRDIGITLVKTGAKKGAVKTRLKIKGNNVDDILSDGEQKAVGLALFLAEIESQNDKSPIVFDDPVTSIDHEIAHSLAKRFLEISLERQIIIFTHNKLFFDSLTYWAKKLKDKDDNRTHHLCKNYGNGNKCKDSVCIYTYRAKREAKDKTGRLFEFQQESTEYFLEKAVKEIEGNYDERSVSGYLKSAVEHYIDTNILKGVGLVKDNKVKENINWEGLKKINPNKETLIKLKQHWDNLSERGSHLSSHSSENPLTKEEFNEIITFLRT